MGRAREESDWAGAELGMVGLKPGQAWVGLRKGEVGGMGLRGQGQGKDHSSRLGLGRSGETGMASLVTGMGGVWAWPAWSWVWMRCGRGQATAAAHLLQLQPHFVEGSQPVGLGSRHGVLTLLAFLIFSGPETEAKGFMMLQGQHSLRPPLSK